MIIHHGQPFNLPPNSATPSVAATLPPPPPPQIIFRRRLNLSLPTTLSTILAEDRKFVQQQYMTARVPPPTLTIDQLLAKLEQNRVQELGGRRWGWRVGERFLRTYFNVLLVGSFNVEHSMNSIAEDGLLFSSSERVAHERLTQELDVRLVLGLLVSTCADERLERADPEANHVDYTAHYGPVHLLRFFGLLSRLLAEAKLVVELSEFALGEMVAYFADVLAYLEEHRTELFGPGQYESSYSALVGREIQRALAGSGDHGS